MSTGLKELGTKSSQAFIGQVIGQLLLCTFVVLIGRSLGAALYGEYIYVYTFLSFFTIIAKLGMENAIVYYVSNRSISDNEKNSIVHFSLKMSIIVGSMLVIFGYAANELIAIHILNDENYRYLLLMILPTIIIDAVAALMISILRGGKKILEMTFANEILCNIAKIVILAIMYYVLKINHYLALVIPQYLGSILSIIYVFLLLKKEDSDILHKQARLSKSMQIKVLKYSLPLVFMSAVTLINHNIDKYMIGFLFDSASVGVYSVATYISNFSSFALGAVNSIFAPMISELYSVGKMQELDLLYKRATRWIMIINLAIFSMTINFHDEIMQLSGDEFIVGGSALVILMLGQVVNSGVGAVGYLNSMTGHTKINLYSSLAAVFANVILNAILIKPYGMVGAAIASAISFALGQVIMLLFVYRNMKMLPYTKRYIGLFAAFAISTIFTGIVMRYVSLHFLLTLIVGGVIFCTAYIILIYLFAIEQDEKEIIRNILFKRREKKS